MEADPGLREVSLPGILRLHFLSSTFTSLIMAPPEPYSPDYLTSLISSLVSLDALLSVWIVFSGLSCLCMTLPGPSFTLLVCCLLLYFCLAWLLCVCKMPALIPPVLTTSLNCLYLLVCPFPCACLTPQAWALVAKIMQNLHILGS